MIGTDDDQTYAQYAAGAIPRLRRIAYLLCQDWHRADDLTQSALARLYRYWRRAQGVENLDAYVGTILLNVFLAEQRTHWWKATSVSAEPRELAAPAASGGAALDQALDLRAALMTLPPRRRATVVLRYYCDYSVEQAAQVLGCSTGTVKSQTAKALAQLRDVLDPSAPTDEGAPARDPGVSEPGFRVQPSVSEGTL
ncbi:SigE family RNA polymerase sigma factor [Actinospica durhamensis]|uniref:SigE family RNA polymerase sigma factor n=1 Tax=Actinospica durhamensis TaxID=1508375 RepID=A0A941IR11_9ACTN|nr:SigE family RNA polymerase sigma factor [Actinospica durhamensis]MBR7836864.1 SigE family RNA polymerase sigma factor [Actinospica durhamensis]